MKVAINGKIEHMTISEDEQQAIDKARQLARIKERSRPLTESEVLSMLLSQRVQEIEVDDNTALRMTDFYPEWEPGKDYPVGYKLTRNGKLYKVIQAHQSQAGWEPENVPAMFTEINETHDGTMQDPIPYSGNMALEQGKYYFQDEEIYICTRDTVNPVYHALSELIGLYVAIA